MTGVFRRRFSFGTPRAPSVVQTPSGAPWRRSGRRGTGRAAKQAAAGGSTRCRRGEWGRWMEVRVLGGWRWRNSEMCAAFGRWMRLPQKQKRSPQISPGRNLVGNLETEPNRSYFLESVHFAMLTATTSQRAKRWARQDRAAAFIALARVSVEAERSPRVDESTEAGVDRFGKRPR